MRRIENGDLIPDIWSDKEPDPLPQGEPPGTRSQMVDYLTTSGLHVVTVHRYLRPNGQIGASGRLDPKYVLHRGVAYVSYDFGKP